MIKMFRSYDSQVQSELLDATNEKPFKHRIVD